MDPASWTSEHPVNPDKLGHYSFCTCATVHFKILVIAALTKPIVVVYLYGSSIVAIRVSTITK